MKLELRIQFNWLTILLLINLILFLVANIVLSNARTVSEQYQALDLLGGYNYFKVTGGSIWLLITSGFLHFDLFHFLINMYSLFRIGQIVINYYSEKILLSTYILGSIGGSLLTLLSTVLIFNLSGVPSGLFSLGASSGIFALIGLLLGGTLRRTRFGFSLPFSFADILPIAAFSLIIGFIPGSNINNWAHLGGLFAGILIGVVLPNALSFKNKRERVVETLLYTFSFIALILSFAALILSFVLIIFN